MVAALRKIFMWSILRQSAFNRKSLAWRPLAQRYVFGILRRSRQAAAFRRREIVRSKTSDRLRHFFAMSIAGCARNPAQREVSPALHEGKVSPIRAPVRPVDTPNHIDMPNQKSGGRTWRCCHRSRPPIASSNDPTSRPWIRTNGPA